MSIRGSSWSYNCSSRNVDHHVVVVQQRGAHNRAAARQRTPQPARKWHHFTRVIWICSIAEDLVETPLPIVEPSDLNDQILAFGFRSMLRIHLRARDERMGLAFWSKRPRAFTIDDVPIARRVADHVALVVSHEQLAIAARQIAEAEARAERLEATVRSLTEELDARRGRVLGESPEWQLVLKHAAQVAPTDTTVLLTGESGTGAGSREPLSARWSATHGPATYGSSETRWSARAFFAMAD